MAARSRRKKVETRKKTVNKKFNWNEGTRFSGNAQDVGERIEQLREKKGGPLQREDLLKDARKKTSPLNVDVFKDPDSKAAEKWRLEICGRILRSISWVVLSSDEEGKEIEYHPPVVVRVPGIGYELSEVVFSDDDMLRSVFNQLLDDLRAIRRKYKRYEEFAEVLPFLEALQVIERRVERDYLDDD